MESIQDGTGNTFAIGERLLTKSGNAGAIWMRSTNMNGDGGDGSAVSGVCSRTVMLNDLTKVDAFSSAHDNGTFFLMADGSVRFVLQSIEKGVYERHAGIDDSK